LKPGQCGHCGHFFKSWVYSNKVSAYGYSKLRVII
jgi:hypothetical protein